MDSTDKTYNSIMASLARIENNQNQFYEQMMRMIEILQDNITKNK